VVYVIDGDLARDLRDDCGSKESEGFNLTDIFISYASADRRIAERLSAALQEDGWEVFWDRRIEAGAEWNDEIQRALKDARCVLVLWSAASRGSFWVRGEAADAYERNTYLPVRVDDTEPPRLFAHLQVETLANWANDTDREEFTRLKMIIHSRIGELPMYGNLETVTEGQPVTTAHLHIVHSCWRVDKKTEFGLMPYQIHLIVYGHRTVLDRIESVEYLLPGYPGGHERQVRDSRDRLFELKELANGFSIAQAHVKLRLQPSGHPKVLHLSRFINMSESGPRLEDDFMRRRPRQ